MTGTYRIVIEGEDLQHMQTNCGALTPAVVELILLGSLASLQRELLVARLGLPAFGQRIVAPPDGRMK